MKTLDAQESLNLANKYFDLIITCKATIYNLQQNYENRHKKVFPQLFVKDGERATTLSKALPRLINRYNQLLDQSKIK
jgi:hypothetical protein